MSFQRNEDARQRELAWNRAYYFRRQQRGLCPRCGGAKPNSWWACTQCRRQRAIYHQAWRKTKKKLIK